MAADIITAINASLSVTKSQSSEGATGAAEAAAKIRDFRDKAMDILEREKAYPRTAVASSDEPDDMAEEKDGQMVLSVLGLAPLERRLFSSLPQSDATEWAEHSLPAGVSISRVAPSNPQEKAQTLGELFAPPRTLLSLQPPKQPKTQAKGNALDFYHPELSEHSKYRSNTYSSQKLAAGHFLDYSHATPSSQTVPKQHERAQSLAGKKPSSKETEVSEMESLFRGAFSSFAPCKDDAAAVVPSNVAGRMWWRGVGQRNFQRMIEVEYYQDLANGKAAEKDEDEAELDEAALQDALDNWDDAVVDPSLDDVMGAKRDDEEKDADEILDEVSDLIETLASYQRIRNLQLPNSQNRQSSDPVNGDMLTSAGPQLTDEEQATYQVLKAQLALIIKTLPPFAVAKLNGDQLEDLLISTKVQIQTDQYKGIMEEDDAALQARLRAQQQMGGPPVRQGMPAGPPAMPGTPYANHYQAGGQYGTPTRTPSMSQQQYFRPGSSSTPNYQQPRNMTPSGQQPPRPQPNQYSRPNGYPNQFATQLAKAQTPYGHQNMPQYAGQQRPGQFGQMPQQGTPNMRFPYQQGHPQQPGTPGTGNYQGGYTNGSGMPAGVPPRTTMSPQVPPRQSYNTPSPNMQQQPPRFGTPNQSMSSQMNRFPSNPQPTQGSPQHGTGLTGYHTVIPEAQQQRILDQAKARVAAQERTANFTDKIAQPGVWGLAGIGLGGQPDANRLANQRADSANQQVPMGQRRPSSNSTPGALPYKVTPVPVPTIPGLQRNPSS